MEDSSTPEGVRGRVAHPTKLRSQSENTPAVTGETSSRPVHTNSDHEDKTRPDVTPAVPKRTSDVKDKDVLPPLPPRTVKHNETAKKEGSKVPAKPPMDTSTHSATASRSATAPHSPTVQSQPLYITAIPSDGDGIIRVSGFEKSMTEEALKLHFENHRKSEVGPVESVSITYGAAIVHFKHAADAQNVLGNKQMFRNDHLSVAPYLFPKASIQNMFVVSGLNHETHEDMLIDFLESETNCSVLDVNEYGQKGRFLVVFSEEAFPEFEQLQEICKKNTLDGSSLKVGVYQVTEEDYMEGLSFREIQITMGAMKFFEKYDSDVVKKEMEKLHVTFYLDKTEFKVIVYGSMEHLSKGTSSMQSFLNRIRESELQFSMPGIADFLESESASEGISSIESEERCIIDVHEGTYEVISGLPEPCSGHDTESESSGDSGISSKQIEIDKVIMNITSQQSMDGTQDKKDRKKGVFGEFQIGSIRFVMKKGKVDTENSDCLVNIAPQSHIEDGDLWRDLSKQTQEELTKQVRVGRNPLDWTKTGIITTSASGMPSNKVIVHASQGHFKGDLVKTVNKCLQVANKIEGVSSVAFFSMHSKGKKDAPMEDYSPLLLFEAINKFQRAAKSNITTVHLVMENMQTDFVKTVTDEVHRLQEQKEQDQKSFFKGKLKLQKRRSSLTVISCSSAAHGPQGVYPEEQEREEEKIAPYALVKADVTVYIYSHEWETNYKAFEKLTEFCQRKMPPKKVEDVRIKKLTTKHIKRLRSNKVEVDVDIERGSVEIRGYQPDVNNFMDRKLTKILDEIQDTKDKFAKPPQQKDKEKDENVKKKIADDQRLADDDEVFHREDENKYMKMETRVVSTVSNVSDGGKQEDEYDIFGRFVASEIRAIPDDRAKRKIKLDIQKLLMEVDSKYLDK